MLYSLAVIELAKKGLEATTYELIITLGNASLAVSGIISTQLMTPLKAAGCSPSDDDESCPSDTVNISSVKTFEASDGPKRFTYYCLVLTAVSIVACFMFTMYLPRSKAQCHEWKIMGDKLGTSKSRGYIALVISFVTVIVSHPKTDPNVIHFIDS